MGDSMTIAVGGSLLSKGVYFVNNRGEKVRPVFQKDRDTGQRSYRVYVDRGNKKGSDLDVFSAKKLAHYLLDGTPVRCKLPDGASSNRFLGSKDIKKLVVEKGVI